VLPGLEGETPEGVDVDTVPVRLEKIRTRNCLRPDGTQEIPNRMAAISHI
jgi:hypothetical protein